jgi:uncharacterized protein YgiM (DUF1202 family)
MKSVTGVGVLAVVVMCVYGFAQSQGTVERNANLRAQPSVRSARIGTLPKGSSVTLLTPHAKDGFYHVRGAAGEGWVSARLMKVAAAPPSSRKLVRRPVSAELEPHLTAAMATGGKCATDLASCPNNGCSPADSPHGLLNQLKRTVPTGTSAAMLTFDDFAALQQQADSLVGEDKELTAEDRAQLRNLTVANGQVSEGDVVSLVGYLVGTPHPNTGESVNCNLHGEPNNDYHIPISNDPANTDFQGIVVEMIPQSRLDNWNLANLTQTESNQQLVMVTGALFYDNLHNVNADPNNPKGGQPHRFALWEIHPITQFVVCSKPDNTCDPAQSGDWGPLGGGQ